LDEQIEASGRGTAAQKKRAETNIKTIQKRIEQRTVVATKMMAYIQSKQLARGFGEEEEEVEIIASLPPAPPACPATNARFLPIIFVFTNKLL